MSKSSEDRSEMDSGFLSGTLSTSSDINLESSDSIQASRDDFPDERRKSLDSVMDSGVIEDLSQLSIEPEVVKPPPQVVVKDPEVERMCEILFAQDEDGDTQLHLAIIQKFQESAFYIMNVATHPSMLNLLNDDWLTALHIAVLTRQPVVARGLILAGCDPKLRSTHGNTALHLACEAGDLHCVKAILEPLTKDEKAMLANREHPVIRPNLEIRNFDGLTCLHVAARSGFIVIIEELVRAGASVDAFEGCAGRTALHLAIEFDQRDVVMFLLNKFKPNLEARTYAGLTSYQSALYFSRKEMARWLLQAGAQKLSLRTEDPFDSDDEDDEPTSPTLASFMATVRNPNAIRV